MQLSVLWAGIGVIWGYLCCQTLLWLHVHSHMQSQGTRIRTRQKQPSSAFFLIKEKLHLESFHQQEFTRYHAAPSLPQLWEVGVWLCEPLWRKTATTQGVRTGVSTTLG